MIEKINEIKKLFKDDTLSGKERPKSNGIYNIADFDEIIPDDFFINTCDTVFYSLNGSSKLKVILILKNMLKISKILNELGLYLNKNNQFPIMLSVNNIDNLGCWEWEYIVNYSDKLYIIYKNYEIKDCKIIINKSLISDKTNIDKVFINCIYSNNNNIDMDEQDSNIIINIKN